MSDGAPPSGPATLEPLPMRAGPGLARRWMWPVAVASLVGLLGLVAVCESRGWPFLAQPAQHWLTARLGRTVHLVDAGGQGFALKLLGPIRLSVDALRIDNPAWSSMGPLLDADKLQLQLRWSDLLGWRPGRSLALQELRVARLDLQLQRLADGRASWVFQPPDPATPQAASASLADVLTVQRVALATGRIQLQDALAKLQLDGQFSQRDATTREAGALLAEAKGRYDGKPLRATLQAGTPSGWLADALALDAAVPLTISVHAGQASLDFGGELRHLLQAPEISGHYRISGPSLAAVGAPLGITLPQTHRFDMAGHLVHAGNRWYTVVERASVGGSRLGGAFVFEQRPGRVPLLAGRLSGSSLLLQDLGPALGVASADQPAAVRAGGRVLPDRPFNLPSLRAMDAQLLVALDKLDFGTPTLQPAAPLRGRIRLSDGVLVIDQIDATLAQGQLSGRVQLDGRQAPARWALDLVGRKLRIEQWLRATQRQGQAPYASGRLDGRLTLAGSGNSTAELLASADGRMRAHWRDGQISHLLVEAAGLDIAQGLGVLLRGDDDLTVHCGAADVRVTNGLAQPQVLLVDTRDSLLWVDGSASMATERLQLQAHVQPKDWSPLSLRAPLHIGGTLGAPALSLDKPELLRRALPAALLALGHPLAALLPLMDGGDDAAGPPAAGCQALVRRFRAGGLTG